MKHILVTTDFSACSVAAFANAIELQKVFAARLTIASVIEDSEVEIARAHHNIESIRRTHFGQIPAQTAIIRNQGSVSRDIVEYARCHSVALIVIASHGRAGLKRLGFGIVAEEVLRAAPCPVLIIPFYGRQKTTNHDGLHIVVTTDLSEASESAFPPAREVLEAYGTLGAHMTVLHVAENMISATFNHPLGESREAILSELETNAEKSLEELRGKHFDGTLATTCVIRGDKPIFQEIVDYADARDTDMLIVSSHGHSLMEEVLLGSVAEKLVRYAKRPVIVVPRQQNSVSPGKL